MKQIKTDVDEVMLEAIDAKARKLKVSRQEMLRKIIWRYFWRIDVGLDQDFSRGDTYFHAK